MEDITVYDYNKAGYGALPPYDSEGLKLAEKNIKEYLKKSPSKYYLLLNNDEHYYTMFAFKDEYKFVEMTKEILDIATELGPIHGVEDGGNGALEFWIKFNGECQLFYLFDYQRGVIEI